MGRFLNLGSALFRLLIRPISHFYSSDGETLVLSLSIPLQIKYVFTGQLYMQVPVKIWIIAAFKIKSKKRLMTCPQTVPLQSRLIMSLEIRLSFSYIILLNKCWRSPPFNFLITILITISNSHKKSPVKSTLRKL